MQAVTCICRAEVQMRFQPSLALLLISPICFLSTCFSQCSVAHVVQQQKLCPCTSEYIDAQNCAAGGKWGCTTTSIYISCPGYCYVTGAIGCKPPSAAQAKGSSNPLDLNQSRILTVAKSEISSETQSACSSPNAYNAWVSKYLMESRQPLRKRGAIKRGAM